jgi:TorA maturation chaperone TorD
MHHLETADWHLARSHVYGLLGELLSDRPASETILQLTNPQTMALMEALFDDPEVASKLNRLAISYREGGLLTEAVALDFEALMRVPGASYTHPYESCYNNLRSGEGRLKWGAICGPQTRAVERLYQEEGLAPRYDRVDFADHIGAELAFMAHMCRKTAKAIQARQFDTGEDLKAKQLKFAQGHVFIWAENFCAELETKADTLFFQAVAAILAAFLRMEKKSPPRLVH